MQISVITIYREIFKSSGDPFLEDSKDCSQNPDPPGMCLADKVKVSPDNKLCRVKVKVPRKCMCVV